MATNNLRELVTYKLVLLISGLVAVGIAAAIIVAPDGFYAAYGIDLAGNANLTNELKAPAGVLFAAGLMMLAGVFRKELIGASLVAGTTVYLGYGLSRILSIAVDGVANSGLVGAAVFEIAAGIVCLLALVTGRSNQITRNAQ